MTKLEQIQKVAQYAVSAIAAALEMDVAFIDENFHLIATSKTFLKKRGTKINKDFIRGVFKKKVVIVPNPGFNELCSGCDYEGNCPETAEIVRTIEFEGRIIGVILMVAYTQQQREKLLGNTAGLLDFIGEMAKLVCNEIKLNQMLKKEKVIQRQLESVINFIDTGIITIDSDGIISQANKSAVKLLRLTNGVIGEPLKKYLSQTDFFALLRQGSIARREVIPLFNSSAHCLLSGRGIKVGNSIVGAIISLENIKKMRSVVYDYSERQIETTLDDIHGISHAIVEKKRYAKQIAKNDSTVLIQGESGTGKELFARSIHNESKRFSHPFIPINCAAIPETLLESELFGYADGAFSGARKGGKPGKFEIANGGTIFLDEIGDMPLHMQVKLLRVLQEKSVERIGGIKSIDVDIRVITATNKDLMEMKDKGEFREDLFFRLNVMPLSIPPLRKRREDILVLCDHFLKKYAKILNNNIIGFSEEAADILKTYHWPGNAREVQKAVEYAVNLEKTNYITPKNLPKSLLAYNYPRKYKTLAEKTKHFEISVIKELLESHGYGVQGKSTVADKLGISVPTLYRKMQHYNIKKTP